MNYKKKVLFFGFGYSYTVIKDLINRSDWIKESFCISQTSAYKKEEIKIFGLDNYFCVEDFKISNQESFNVLTNNIDADKKRFLNKIELKHTEISNHIKDKYKNHVGIHIRRGSGVSYTEDDIKSLPEKIQDKYRKYRKEIASLEDDNYQFTRDDFYFKLIEKFLQHNPAQKIYISHDLEDEYIFQYYDKFGHHVIESKYNNRYFYEHYYSNSGVDVKHLKNYCNGIDNVVDLFTLSNCGMVIGSAHSTWSEFSRDYSKKLYNDTNDPFKDIVDNHKNLTITSKSLF